MQTPDKLGQRVRLARAHADGMSQEKLAKKLGIKQPSVQALETGDAVRSKYLADIARETGVRQEWLEKGTGPMVDGAGNKSSAVAPNSTAEIQTPLTSADINIASWPRDVPILGGGAAGGDGLFELNGQVIDKVRRPPRLADVKDAYALFVYGDSMSPWRENGQTVYVHPHLPPQIGDYVVVQMRQEHEGGPLKAYIKKLVRRSASELRLLQFNPREEITIPMRKVWKIERVLDWQELIGM